MPAQQEPAIPTAPILWKFASGNKDVGGLFVDDGGCWVGNDANQVFALNHEGEVQKAFQLPAENGVDFIAGDGNNAFAVNGAGGIYNLSADPPCLAAPFVQVRSLAVSDGVRVVARHDCCFASDPDNRLLWRNKAKAFGCSVSCDRLGAYFLDAECLSAYGMEKGDLLWQHPLNGMGRTTWQTLDRVYADSGADGHVHCCDKKTGEAIAQFPTDVWILCGTTSPDDQRTFVASKDDHLLCFDAKGNRLWKLATGCGMPFRTCFWNDRLYVVTLGGFLICVDVGDEAIRKAQTGRVPEAKLIEPPKSEGLTTVEPPANSKWIEWPRVKRSK